MIDFVEATAKRHVARKTGSHLIWMRPFVLLQPHELPANVGRIEGCRR